MSKILQLRRGSQAQHATFTGASGELTYDTTNKRLVVHDGATAGGFPLARASEVPAFFTTLTAFRSATVLTDVVILLANINGDAILLERGGSGPDDGGVTHVTDASGAHFARKTLA